MNEFVHLSPVILTDEVFFGSLDADSLNCTGTSAQRQVAYLQAEQAMIRQLKTPLLPTAITGTFHYRAPEKPVVLPYTWLHSVDSVTVRYAGGTGTCGLQTTEGCHRIRDTIGYVDLHVAGEMACQSCSITFGQIYDFQISYTAGLPTGVAADDTSLHLALSMVAEEVLNEIADPGANPGGPGAPGIKSFGTLGYSETLDDKAITQNSLGTSARMNKAASFVRHLKKKRARGLRL